MPLLADRYGMVWLERRVTPRKSAYNEMEIAYLTPSQTLIMAKVWEILKIVMIELGRGYQVVYTI